MVKDDEVVPLESKYKNNIKKKDMEGEELIDGKLIVFVPLWKWLLERGDHA